MYRPTVDLHYRFLCILLLGLLFRTCRIHSLKLSYSHDFSRVIIIIMSMPSPTVCLWSVYKYGRCINESTQIRKSLITNQFHAICCGGFPATGFAQTRFYEFPEFPSSSPVSPASRRKHQLSLLSA